MSLLYHLPKPTRWSKGIGAELPEAYKKFWREWKLQQPTAVHYIKEEGTYVRDERTDIVKPVQNIPLPLTYPKEFDNGIWGGEAIVRGFMKRTKLYRRTPKFWFPQLKSSVVYSEVLDLYMKTVITLRTIHLIHESYGFDHYLLKTPACDLRSLLALKIKRNILIALADKTLYPDDPVKREEVYDHYKQYLSAYTREEIDWYGLTYKEACQKWLAYKAEQNVPKPLKHEYRSELLAMLKEKGLPETLTPPTTKQASQWSKLNPFSKN